MTVCELCGCPGELTKHHLIPNPVRRRRKRKKKRGREERETALRSVLLCRDCHRQLHALFTEKELASMSWDEIKSKESVRKWVDWIRKKRGQRREQR